MQGKITQHFTWREALRSQTAHKHGLDNTPGPEAIQAIKSAAECMEFVRSLLGLIIDVTSWFRSPLVNEAVGGSPTSDHVTGWALDFRARGLSAHIAARRIIKSPIMFDQLIWYPGEDRLHISFAPGDRRDVLTKPKGQPGYLPGLVLST
ncbi:D-Ala-D-Ala carboxypeptidase family metallohydrolase [Oceanicaulis sp.]|uniref:D-Ala-D-Ala carboxypeptidase family metallohydrolase n=1 Tax=Oceanicaulis sp. TaxID=1924941 RepID=UPI003D278ABF